jgi:hypothetical protein
MFGVHLFSCSHNYQQINKPIFFPITVIYLEQQQMIIIIIISLILGYLQICTWNKPCLKGM